MSSTIVRAKAHRLLGSVPIAFIMGAQRGLHLKTGEIVRVAQREQWDA
jgi:hypothetical protein